MLFLLTFENLGSYVKQTAIDFYNKWLFYYRSFHLSLFNNKPLIHVIGDSHTKIFRRSELFVVYHVGPATAHNLNKNNSITNSNKTLFTIIDKINKKRDIVMLVFGEIDCRIHIYNQYKKNNGKFTLTELIDRTIENYGSVLKQLDLMEICFFLYGIPPATTQGNVYGYPFYATPEIHGKIYREFNERLKKFCTKNSYNYMDIYSIVSDENGFVLEEYVADAVHLNSKVVKFVRNWISMQLFAKKIIPM